MGSPVSPAVANIFMGAWEEKALRSYNACKPRVWWRFVDDIFAIVKRLEVQLLMQHLNAQHPNIQLTVEVEEDGCLPFMDLNVQRRFGEIETTVHRKPTHTDRYLQFDPHHPRCLNGVWSGHYYNGEGTFTPLYKQKMRKKKHVMSKRF